jgi:hypothetical protein
MIQTFFQYIFDNIKDNPFLLILSIIAFFIFKDVHKRLILVEKIIENIELKIASLVTELTRLVSFLKGKNVIDKDQYTCQPCL